jgi:hypothetical protein
VSKFLFDTHEDAQPADSGHQPRIATQGAKVGENWSVTRNYPVENGWFVVLLQCNCMRAESYPVPQTGYQPVIDRFSPIEQKSDFPLLLHDPVNRSTNTTENEIALLLLLKINKYLFCSYKRTAPGFPPTRTTA